jgi:hypothetical protein
MLQAAAPAAMFAAAPCCHPASQPGLSQPAPCPSPPVHIHTHTPTHPRLARRLPCLSPPRLPRPLAGACLGTGIDRDKVGDILITGEQGAQILVAPNLVEHLMVALTQVGWLQGARSGIGGAHLLWGGSWCRQCLCPPGLTKLLLLPVTSLPSSSSSGAAPPAGAAAWSSAAASCESAR